MYWYHLQGLTRAFLHAFLAAFDEVHLYNRAQGIFKESHNILKKGRAFINGEEIHFNRDGFQFALGNQIHQ